MIADVRPDCFGDIVGQKDAIAELSIKVEASRLQDVPMDHVLITAEPGMGKSTIAYALSHEVGHNLHYINAARLDTWQEVYSAISECEDGDILFIDEIHELRNRMQHMLYDVMEDYKCNVFEGRGQDKVSITKDLPRFTLLGATTHEGTLTGPLLRRFGTKIQLTRYTTPEIKEMVELACMRMYDSEFPVAIASEMARLSRRNPSVAYQLLKSFKQSEIVEKSHRDAGTIFIDTIKRAKLDPLIGLDLQSRKYLTVLARKFPSSVGVETLAALIGTQPETVKSRIEPFLLSQIDFDNEIGPFVDVDKRGRRITESGRKYLAYCIKLQDEKDWFHGEDF